MEETKSPSTLERNPITYARHKREVFWQITIPVGISVLIMLLLAVLTLTGSEAAVSKGADIALSWLILPVMLLTLILIVVLFGVIFGVTSLNHVLPNYALQILNLFIDVKNQVVSINNKLVQPIIRTEVFKASLKGLRRGIRGK